MNTSFTIEGIDKLGKFVSIEVQATSSEDAVKRANEKLSQVLCITPKKRWVSILLNDRKSNFPLLLFNQELIALLEAGLNIVESLEALLEKESQTHNKNVMEDLVENLREGKALSISMQRQPFVFPNVYIAAISAGERSGNLLDPLKRFVKWRGCK